ncbi:FAD-binding domain-containing protein [Marasmius fiardii PR-910]|nr:FAD-binding domain-containing protein [Marasmius fiardii PR-910]
MLVPVILIATLTAYATGRDLPSCRTLPTDSSWPARNVWNAFNESIDGRLIRTVPIGSPCHDPNYDEAQCKVVRDNWHAAKFLESYPSSVMDHALTRKSCDPFDSRELPCQIGSYAQHVVNVSSPDHVIKTLQFVKEHNIRFVVKNSGHDGQGRSTGTGAVSVWMHNLQDITFIPEFKSSIYAGPAFKVHAGVRGADIAKAANSRGLVVVSGGCPTVSFAGGYIQGGGHSPLTSFYGLAADQTLEFEVITTRGEFVRASPTENQDLYWALSGGGGGTYGIVWSATVKAHRDLPVTFGSITFTSQGIDQEIFYKALDAFQANTARLADGKVWATAQYTNRSFSLRPVSAVNQTSAEVSALLRPFLNTLSSLGVNYSSEVKTYDIYLAAYNTLDFLVNTPVGAMTFGSRLIPRSLFEDNERLKGGQKAIRSILERGNVNILDFVLKPTLEVAGNPENGVLPAWREAIKHIIIAVPLADGESSDQIAEKQKKADPKEPDFKQAFYGSKYDKLLAIKDKWDPEQILYGAISVGGDRWRETAEGRLCKN